MTRRRTLRTCLSTVLFAWSVASGAEAHTRSQSFSSWYIDDDHVRMTFSVEAREVTRLPLIEGAIPELDQLLVTHLRSRIRAMAGEMPCAHSADLRVLPARDGYVRVEWQFQCPPEAALTIVNDAFFEVAPSHVHYARVKQGTDLPVEYLFTDAQRAITISREAEGERGTTGAGFVSYVGLGTKHILAGIDHVAFLVTLLLLCRRPREVFFMVTGFTLGHSATLGLAVLGIVEPNVPVIEALIGYTIALVAAENIAVEAGAGRAFALVGGGMLAGVGVLSLFLPVGLSAGVWLGLAVFTWCYLSLSATRAQAAALRPILTIVFGLIHGLGFANVLMDIGLPQGRLLPALLGFNVGVELGQLGIVAGLWCCALFAARWISTLRRGALSDVVSATLCGVGVFWLVQRAMLIA